MGAALERVGGVGAVAVPDGAWEAKLGVGEEGEGGHEDEKREEESVGGTGGGSASESHHGRRSMEREVDRKGSRKETSCNCNQSSGDVD